MEWLKKEKAKKTSWFKGLKAEFKKIIGRIKKHLLSRLWQLRRAQ